MLTFAIRGIKFFFCDLGPQIEEINENQEASLMEMETTHNDTLATLQEEHARTVKSKHLKTCCAPVFTHSAAGQET